MLTTFGLPWLVDLCPHLRMVLSLVCVILCKSPFFIRTVHIGIKGPPYSSMTSSLPIILAMTLVPSRSPSEVLGLGPPHMNCGGIGGDTVKPITGRYRREAYRDCAKLPMWKGRGAQG